jgi:hypothetical protein
VITDILQPFLVVHFLEEDRLMVFTAKPQVQVFTVLTANFTPSAAIALVMKHESVVVEPPPPFPILFASLTLGALRYVCPATSFPVHHHVVIFFVSIPIFPNIVTLRGILSPDSSAHTSSVR